MALLDEITLVLAARYIGGGAFASMIGDTDRLLRSNLGLEQGFSKREAAQNRLDTATARSAVSVSRLAQANQGFVSSQEAVARAYDKVYNAQNQYNTAIGRANPTALSAAQSAASLQAMNKAQAEAIVLNDKYLASQKRVITAMERTDIIDAMVGKRRQDASAARGVLQDAALADYAAYERQQNAIATVAAANALPNPRGVRGAPAMRAARAGAIAAADKELVEANKAIAETEQIVFDKTELVTLAEARHEAAILDQIIATKEWTIATDVRNRALERLNDLQDQITLGTPGILAADAKKIELTNELSRATDRLTQAELRKDAAVSAQTASGISLQTATIGKKLAAEEVTSADAGLAAASMSPMGGMLAAAGPTAIAAAAIGLGVALTVATKSAIELSTAEAQVAAQTGNTMESMKKLGDTMLTYAAGGSSFYDAKTLVEGTLLPLSAGMKPAEVQQLIPDMQILSKMTAQPDLKMVGQVVSTAMGGLFEGPNTTAKQIKSLLEKVAYTEQNAPQPPGAITGALPNLFASLRGTGTSDSDALAMLLTATRQGIQASDATHWIGMMARSLLLKPNTTAQNIAHAAGFDLGLNAEAKAGGILPYVSNIWEKIGGNIPDPTGGAQRTAAQLASVLTSSGTGGVLAQKMFMILAGGGNIAAVEAMSKAMDAHTKSLERANEILDKGPIQNFAQLGSEFNAQLTSLGQNIRDTVVPALIAMASAALKITGGAGDIFGKLGGFMDTHGGKGAYLGVGPVDTALVNFAGMILDSRKAPPGTPYTYKGMKGTVTRDASGKTFDFTTERGTVISGLTGNELATQQTGAHVTITHRQARLPHGSGGINDFGFTANVGGLFGGLFHGVGGAAHQGLNALRNSSDLAAGAGSVLEGLGGAAHQSISHASLARPRGVTMMDLIGNGTYVQPPSMGNALRRAAVVAQENPATVSKPAQAYAISQARASQAAAVEATHKTILEQWNTARAILQADVKGGLSNAQLDAQLLRVRNLAANPVLAEEMGSKASNLIKDNASDTRLVKGVKDNRLMDIARANQDAAVEYSKHLTLMKASTEQLNDAAGRVYQTDKALAYTTYNTGKFGTVGSKEAKAQLGSALDDATTSFNASRAQNALAANQKLVDAATVMLTAANIQLRSASMHHGTMQEESGQAQNIKKAMDHLSLTTYRTGGFGDPKSALAWSKLQDALMTNTDQLITNNQTAYQAGLQPLQDQLSLDQARGVGKNGQNSPAVATDVANMVKYIKDYGGKLNNETPTQIALDVLNLQNQNKVAVTPAVQLIRPQSIGTGGLVDPTFGTSYARLAGGLSGNNALAELQKENASLRNQVAYLERLAAGIDGVNGKLGTIVRQGGVKPPPPSPKPKVQFGNIMRHQ